MQPVPPPGVSLGPSDGSVTKSRFSLVPSNHPLVRQGGTGFQPQQPAARECCDITVLFHYISFYGFSSIYGK